MDARNSGKPLKLRRNDHETAPSITTAALGDTHLKEDPQYPSLHFKKVERFWSARVGGNYRAVAIEGADGLVWFWLGTHADYDKLLG